MAWVAVDKDGIEAIFLQCPKRMRVIKKGKLPPKEKKMTCPECGCVFMYERSDVNSDQREGCWVVCPTCKKYITVDGRW